LARASMIVCAALLDLADHVVIYLEL